VRTVLVPIESTPQAETILEAACRVAEFFGGLVEGFPLVRTRMSGIGWDPESLVTIDPADAEDGRATAEAKARFTAFMRDRGVAEEGPGPGEGARWRWTHDRLEGHGFLGAYGRGFDLTAVGQPGSERGASTIGALEAALFDSGGPVLIVPQDGEAIRLRLSRNGVPADLKLLGGGQVRSGEALLREAAAIGCDLLVKGAYTQSRIRQMIFGGATQHIIAKASMPVLMAH
jgi:nucleotide-binding universal stress UspA family protein